MNGAMVRATLAGTKSQTRRVMKRQPEHPIIIAGDPHTMRYQPEGGEALTLASLLRHCPHGQLGDRLYVRETFQGPLFPGEKMDDYLRDSAPFENPEFCVYAADGGSAPEFQDADDNFCCRWRPSIHMPRWASRIMLEITSVRIERLQDISDADIEAEGIDMVALTEAQERYDVVAKDGNASGRPTLRSAWRDLWESTGGDWDTNPWLWAISFKRVTP